MGSLNRFKIPVHFGLNRSLLPLFLENLALLIDHFIFAPLPFEGASSNAITEPNPNPSSRMATLALPCSAYS